MCSQVFTPTCGPSAMSSSPRFSSSSRYHVFNKKKVSRNLKIIIFVITFSYMMAGMLQVLAYHRFCWIQNYKMQAYIANLHFSCWHSWYWYSCFATYYLPIHQIRTMLCMYCTDTSIMIKPLRPMIS